MYVNRGRNPDLENYPTDDELLDRKTIVPDIRSRETDGHTILYNMTELLYSVPHGTALVEVLGPVGDHPDWAGDSECYATLEPPPLWWQDGVFPTSVSRKTANASDQTMFLLPLSPHTQYKLYVGGLSPLTSCPISAIRTYPVD